jgi:hypothetical protein
MKQTFTAGEPGATLSGFPPEELRMRGRFDVKRSSNRNKGTSMYVANAVVGRMVPIRGSKRYSSFKRSVLPILAFVMLAVATGCRDAITPVERTLRPPPVLSHDMQASPPVTKTLPFTPLGEVFMASYPYKEGVLVEGRINGTINVTSDPLASCVHANGDVDYLGVWIYCTGAEQCSWSAGIRAAQGTRPSLASCASRPHDPRYTSTETWRDTILVGGINGSDGVYAVRGGGSLDPLTCGSNPCHTVTGGNTVTITPLAADLDLRGFYGTQAARTVFVPNITHAVGYHTVAFRDSATPRSAKGIPMPFQTISWAWRKTNPNAVPDPYWNSTDINQCPTRTPEYLTSNTCSLNVKESGVLTAVARVNGVQHTDSVCVECSTGDPAVDNTAIRAELMARLQEGLNADPLLRREKGGVIYRDTLSGTYFSVPDTAAVETDCYTIPTIMTVPPGASQVGRYHTHPHEAVDSAAGCRDSRGRPYNRKVKVNPSLNGGGSDSDWGATSQGFPEYIVSLRGEMVRLNADSQNLTAIQKESNPNRWYWRIGLCAWRDALQ